MLALQVTGSYNKFNKLNGYLIKLLPKSVTFGFGKVFDTLTQIFVKIVKLGKNGDIKRVIVGGGGMVTRLQIKYQISKIYGLL